MPPTSSPLVIEKQEDLNLTLSQHECDEETPSLKTPTMGTMAEPARLSKSLENLAADEMMVSLNDRDTFSKSMDNLDDDLSQQSYDRNSMDLNTYFDDDEEGTGEEVAHQIEFPKSVNSDDTVLEGLTNELSKSLEIIDESVTDLTGPVDSENQSDHVSDAPVFESKSHSSKRDNVINSMLVLDDKEKSVLHKHWDDLKIDKDIQVSVNEFARGFFEHYLHRACNDEKILLIKALHERALKSEITKWLSAKLQIERDGWSLKLKMALKEVEDNRKSALKAAALTQNCSEQLRLLLECFNISDSVLDSIPKSNSREAIQRSLEILVEICNALMEDRFHCMQQLNMEDEGGSMAESLHHHLGTQEANYRRELQEATQQAKQAEFENLKLLKEVVKMKKILSQKQQDVESLREQMTDINDIVSKQVRMADKSTSTDPSTDVKKPKHSNHQRPSTDTLVSWQKQAPSNKHSQRPATETKSSAQGREASIHISQEKLHALKQRAKKMEDSLHDAIASMDKLRKTTGPVTNNNNRDIPNDTEFTPLLLNHTCEHGDAVSSKFTAVKKDWEKASFEIKGGPPTTPLVTKSLNPHTTIPKLNLKHSQRNQERRSVSERAPQKEAFREVELKKTVELSATLAQLKAFKPQVGKVSKCLRCQKLFRTIDNHKLACLYHPKKKERVEKYTDGGQLVKVVYLWTCCKQDMDCEGCSYGQHV